MFGGSDLSIGAALGYSVLGLAIVFAMLILLMIVIKIMAAIFNAANAKKGKQAEAAPAAPAPAAAPAAAKPQGKPAPGTAGEVKLYDVSDRDAAMIMAIVADKMQKPLNELRFISIREVK